MIISTKLDIISSMKAKSVDRLEALIRTHRAKVGIIGLGYVGLPLAMQIIARGFNVLGVDIDPERVQQLNRGISYIDDVTSRVLRFCLKKKCFRASGDYRQLRTCDIIMICVPTPVNINKEPDLTPVVESARGIRNILRRGQLIILKSTTYPETTEKVVLPILAETGYQVGRDFFLAFCPERIDPGNKNFSVENTPAVVGGVTPGCTRRAAFFYRQFVKDVHPVSSARAAEMTKLLENTFRNVNIALVNEFAQLCERMGNLDIWEVIEAAKTKPFGYMPFYPGPGVGGHCIPIDPYYLSWKAREYDFHTVFIELSARINEEMPFFVVQKTIEALSKAGVCPSRSSVLLLGMAFKKDISDLRHSPAIRVFEIIKPLVHKVDYFDPHVPALWLGSQKITSTKSALHNLARYDAVLILTDHSAFDYQDIIRRSRLIIDTRNAIKIRHPKVKHLGSGL